MTKDSESDTIEAVIRRMVTASQLVAPYGVQLVSQPIPPKPKKRGRRQGSKRPPDQDLLDACEDEMKALLASNRLHRHNGRLIPTRIADGATKRLNGKPISRHNLDHWFYQGYLSKPPDPRIKGLLPQDIIDMRAYPADNPETLRLCEWYGIDSETLALIRSGDLDLP
jgi:hypothetical protein